MVGKMISASIIALLGFSIGKVDSRFTGIPTVPFTDSGGGSYLVASLKAVVVDANYADARDANGETLIPPSLSQFATTFAADLKQSLGLNVDVLNDTEPSVDSVFLTLSESSEYVNAAGQATSEGYSLSVSPSGLVIFSTSPLGIWWGTRTILQQTLLSANGSIPYGEAHDAPGWSTRGMMLDVGRHFYPQEFITELCAYLSFFKQNTLHLHLSDNLYNNPDYSRERSLSLYARFRLWSDSEDVSGLNLHQNESYTKEQFDTIQSSCAARGVTILPEIEAPGHALVIVQWKPELGLSTDLSLLNISHPESIPTMKTIWNTFIDWFHVKSVHIGADEYTADENDYNLFVNTMASYISEISGKSTRIWGTFPPQPSYDNIYKNVTIQHWEYFEDNPYYDYILNNYTVLNSDDAFYVVNKWSGSYPQVLPLSRTFSGDPFNQGPWYPYIFDMNNASNNPRLDSSLVLGQVSALWNDYGSNATVYSEAYYAWQEGVPALADKQWGGNLTEAEFSSIFPALLPQIPGQNLRRAVESETSSIFNYSFASASSVALDTTDPASAFAQIPDDTGNGYDATSDCQLLADSTLQIRSCSLKTPLSSKGRNYTLSLTLLVDELADSTNATLVSGSDSVLMLTPEITLFASGNHYRLNSTLPLGSWTKLDLIGRGNQTFASMQPLEASGYGQASDVAEEEFLAKLGINGESLVWAPIAVEAPLSEVGGPASGWSGQLRAFSLRSEA